MLSRPGEYRSEWEHALSRVALKWGPWQEDPFGFTGNPTSLFESLQWANRRTLLVRLPGKMRQVLGYVKIAAHKRIPQEPPSSWERMTVIITPLWKGAQWWPLLKAMRVDYIPLGRLESHALNRRQLRNGHPSGWTASLIPTRMPYGHQRHDSLMDAPSEASSCGSSEIRIMERREN